MTLLIAVGVPTPSLTTPQCIMQSTEHGYHLQMGARDRVTEALRIVFSRHGAVAATSAAIGLATDEVRAPAP